MKLHFISAHKKVGPLCKYFGLADGSNKSYPLAEKLTTYPEEIEISKSGLLGYKDLLVTNAAQGHALMKGVFKKELKNQSRRGLADNDAKTSLLVLDVDGLPIKGFTKGNASKFSVEKVAENVLSMLPDELQTVSYIAVGSSSFGRKDNTASVHIHFLLESPVDHSTMKLWLKSLNFTQQELYERLELTPAKLAVKSIVDPCLSEASRIIYIAPPRFGVNANNPFKDNSERIILVEKDTPLLDLAPLLDTLSAHSALTMQRHNDKLHELQRKLGITTRKRKFETVRTSRGDTNVVGNPEEVVMTFAYETDHFVAYNVGGGDSNAYIVQRDNPEIVTCFKPDEPPFLFSKADPQTYAQHIKKYGEKYDQIVDEETGNSRRVRRIMFRDEMTDRYNTLEYDMDSGDVIELIERNNSTTASEYMRYYGQVVPDPVPPMYIVNNPEVKETFYSEGDKRMINRFECSKYLNTQADNPFPNATYGIAHNISVECPLICEIILNMLGDDLECFERFVNWFAYIFQTKKKTTTAWLTHGTEGTGKGIFYHRIVRPIFGQKYSKQTTLQLIADDQFNGWMEDCLFLMVDEFNMSSGSSLTRTANIIKNAITEPTMMMRHMQRMAKDTLQRLNFLMGTNDFDAMSAGDKRRYNIAPRQDRMLKDRKRTSLVNVLRTEVNALIEGELENFSAFLRDFKVKEHLVFNIYESDARDEMLANSQNSAEKFFTNLIKGNFGAFVEILDKQESLVPEKDLMQVRRVKEFIRANLEHVNTKKACYLHKDDLRNLYSYLAGKTIGENAFNQMLKKHAFETKRVQKPVGAIVNHPTRPRCLVVRWTYDDSEILTMLKANNIPLANVTPIQPQYQQLQETMSMADALIREANGDTFD